MMLQCCQASARAGQLTWLLSCLQTHHSQKCICTVYASLMTVAVADASCNANTICWRHHVFLVAYLQTARLSTWRLLSQAWLSITKVNQQCLVTTICPAVPIACSGLPGIVTLPALSRGLMVKSLLFLTVQLALLKLTGGHDCVRT